MSDAFCRAARQCQSLETAQNCTTSFAAPSLTGLFLPCSNALCCNHVSDAHLDGSLVHALLASLDEFVLDTWLADGIDGTSDSLCHCEYRRVKMSDDG